MARRTLNRRELRAAAETAEALGITNATEGQPRPSPRSRTEPARRSQPAPAVPAPHNPTHHAVRRLPFRPPRRLPHLAPSGNHRELADRSPGARRPNPNPTAPQLVLQTLHEAVHSMLACGIDGRIGDS